MAWSKIECIILKLSLDKTIFIVRFNWKKMLSSQILIIAGELLYESIVVFSLNFVILCYLVV